MQLVLLSLIDLSKAKSNFTMYDYLLTYLLIVVVIVVIVVI